MGVGGLSKHMKCLHEKKHCKKYDSYYCAVCNVWTEGKCEDKNCEFCKERPEKPSEVSGEED